MSKKRIEGTGGRKIQAAKDELTAEEAVQCMSNFMDREVPMVVAGLDFVGEALRQMSDRIEGVDCWIARGAYAVVDILSERLNEKHAECESPMELVRRIGAAKSKA